LSLSSLRAVTTTLSPPAANCLASPSSMPEEVPVISVVVTHLFKIGRNHSPTILVPAPTILVPATRVVWLACQTNDPRRPMNKPITNSTKKTKNRILAMLAAVPATTPKPSTPAINAITKKVNAQLNMINSNS